MNVYILLLPWIISAINLKQKFNEYLTNFGKTYTTSEEYEMRLQFFNDSLTRIEQFNLEHSPVFGINKFSDMAREEVRSIHSRPIDLKKLADIRGRKTPTWEGQCLACVRFPELRNTTTPEEWDWRKWGAVTPIKDQGRCGDCFAFGATGDIESSWYLANNSLVSLSEQQITSCDRYRNDEGCYGSETNLDTLQYVINTGGLVSENQYPQSKITYKHGKSGKCDKSKLHDFAATITGKMQISGGHLYDVDEDKAKDALYNLGTMGIAVNSKYFDDYDSGILYVNPSKCKPGDLDHEVLLVGYGVENDHPYWLIKNSWGTDWGEDGYIRVLRGKNVCGVAKDITKSVV